MRQAEGIFSDFYATIFLSPVNEIDESDWPPLLFLKYSATRLFHDGDYLFIHK